MKRAIRQSLASVAVFAAVLLVLASVDGRVRERFEELGAGNGWMSLTSRTGDLRDALMSAARHQSIENAPLVVFAVVGAVLVAFMVRT